MKKLVYCTARQVSSVSLAVKSSEINPKLKRPEWKIEPFSMMIRSLYYFEDFDKIDILVLKDYISELFHDFHVN